MLSISKEEFLELYKGLPICNSVDLFYTEPATDMEILEKYLPSKLWRLNNLYTIVNKRGQRIRFRMNRSQHKAYAAHLRHPRIIILKSRQQGISTLWLISFFDDAITRRDHYIGLMAQGTDEASTLLERVKLLWDELYEPLKQHLNITLVVNNTKEFAFSNGSKLFVRTSFRSATLQRLHISEMGKIANKSPDKASETKTGTLQALAPGNTGVIESTAEGDNMFKEMWDTAFTFTGQRSETDFLPVFLSWLEDPDCTNPVYQIATTKQEEYFAKIEAESGRTLTQAQKNFWLVKYRELGDGIYQEYPSTPMEAFRVAKDGTYYAESYVLNVIDNNREVDYLFDKNLDVSISVDLGRNDTNVLCVYQTHLDEYRIIDEHADNNLPVKPYCDWIKAQPWFPQLRTIHLPHDAEVRSMTDNKTRYEVFVEEMSYILIDGQPQPYNKVYVNQLEKADLRDGIDAVRGILSRLWLDRKCKYIKKCMLNYRKEWNEKLGVFRDEPLHDENSNGAAAVRYMVAAGAVSTSDSLSNRRASQSSHGDMDV